MEGRASWTVPPSAPIPIFLSGRCCGAGAASQAGGAAEPAGPPLPRSRCCRAEVSRAGRRAGRRVSPGRWARGGAGGAGRGLRGGALGPDWLQARRTCRSARAPPRPPAPHAAFTWRRPSLPRAAGSGTWARRAPRAAALLVEAPSISAQWPVFVPSAGFPPHQVRAPAEIGRQVARGVPAGRGGGSRGAGGRTRGGALGEQGTLQQSVRSFPLWGVNSRKCPAPLLPRHPGRDVLCRSHQ